MITDKDTQKINRAIDKWFSEHAEDEARKAGRADTWLEP
jgi:hypothetical protein